MLRSLLPSALLALLPLTTADFLISNTSASYGPSGFATVFTSVAVLSSLDYDRDYTCANLLPRQDHAYISGGTMGPFGDWDLHSDGGICGSGKLAFVKGDTEKDGYMVNDREGKHVGQCTFVNSTVFRPCDEFLGTVLFQATYNCSSPICS